MARNEADLTTFMFASDYDPVHYNWTEKELSTLGDCKAVAEVIKERLEDNGTKVEEMYVIEHKGEKTADSKSEEHHKNIDEAKPHYHILVKFADKQGATLNKIAKYIGVCQEIIEKPKPGGHSYHNMLAYLTHIKYENKIQYGPEDVVTLAGTDYMVHYNNHKESWIKARAIVAKKGGKPLDRRFREATQKLESGELSCEELAGIPEYRKLFLSAKYQRKLEAAEKRVRKLADLDWCRLYNKLRNKEISKEEAKTREEYRLAFKYYSDLII
jgi:exonuclease VII small subunit